MALFDYVNSNCSWPLHTLNPFTIIKQIKQNEETQEFYISSKKISPTVLTQWNHNCSLSMCLWFILIVRHQIVSTYERRWNTQAWTNQTTPNLLKHTMMRQLHVQWCGRYVHCSLIIVGRYLKMKSANCLNLATGIQESYEKHFRRIC